MTPALLKRQSYRPRPEILLLDSLPLVVARCHEVTGPARRSFAMLVARHTQGPVIWIRPAWAAEQLNPDGVLEWMDPGRLLFVAANRTEDVLWSMEEALRAGAVPLVVADLTDPPGLTPVRRLHLAAETGSKEGVCPPLGLILTPGDGGAPGVESRWHMRPTHSLGQTSWQIDRTRARNAAPDRWAFHKTGDGLRLERPGLAT